MFDIGSDDGGATFAEFYAEYPHHAAKRKCKGSGIKSVVEQHGRPFLEWLDSGTCGMGRIQVIQEPHSAPPIIQRPQRDDLTHAKMIFPRREHHHPVSPPNYLKYKNLTVKTNLPLGIPFSSLSLEPTATRLCKYEAHGTTCPYGDRCRYAHHRHSPRSEATPTSGSTTAVASRDTEVAAVVEEAGLEEKWVRHFVSHELDRDALALCEDTDFELLGLPLGARIKLRRWAERERFFKGEVTPPTPEATRPIDNRVAVDNRVAFYSHWNSSSFTD